MNMYVWVLLAAFVLAAGADWLAVAQGRREMESLAKPAALVVLILLAWLLRADTVSYGQFLLVGLALSLVGDVALLGDSDRRFLVGLLAFLAGHLCYLAAFRRIPGQAPTWPMIGLIGVLVLSVIVLRILPRVLADWRDGIPLLAYAVVLGSMAMLAWATGLVVVGVGATIFLASDTLLAYDRFERHLPWGRLAVMVTYHVAQLLIVLGVMLC